MSKENNWFIYLLIKKDNLFICSLRENEKELLESIFINNLYQSEFV